MVPTDRVPAGESSRRSRRWRSNRRSAGGTAHVMPTSLVAVLGSVKSAIESTGRPSARSVSREARAEAVRRPLTAGTEMPRSRSHATPATAPIASRAVNTTWSTMAVKTLDSTNSTVSRWKRPSAISSTMRSAPAPAGVVGRLMSASSPALDGWSWLVAPRSWRGRSSCGVLTLPWHPLSLPGFGDRTPKQPPAVS